MKRIIVPLDGSPLAERALSTAVMLARPTSEGGDSSVVELVLVHAPLTLAAMPDGGIVCAPSTEFDTELRQQSEAYLYRVAARLRAETRLNVVSTVLDGSPSMTLAAHAEAVGADVIVMTSHGRGGLSRVWLGSVTDALVRQGHVPVLVTRSLEDAAPAADDAPFRRVLVPLDGSGLGEETLDSAIALLGVTGVEYTLARVLTPLLALFRSTPEGERDEAPRVAASVDQTDEYLEDLAARLCARGVVVRTAVLVHEHPARAILRYALRTDTDLVVMATHGRNALGRLVMGSVTDKVLRAGVVPVLVQRPSRVARAVPESAVRAVHDLARRAGDLVEADASRRP
ncbi:MAG TPA: universal stress protein [Gemmatimonadaceae bacterium]|nr:universal stress protein [Gemmatimonadaceae bacterium]